MVEIFSISDVSFSFCGLRWEDGGKLDNFSYPQP